MILKLLKLILEIIRIIVGRDDVPPNPGPFRGLKIITNGNPMKYEVDFPAFPTGTGPAVRDITTQRFTSSYVGDDGSSVEDVQDLPGIIDSSGSPTTPAATAQFVVPTETEVTMTLTYVDKGGQSSVKPARQVFTSGGDIPPTDPGDFGEVRVIEE